MMAKPHPMSPKLPPLPDTSGIGPLEPVEFNLEDDTVPGEEEQPDGSVVITLEEGKSDSIKDFDANIAEYLDDSELHTLATDLLDEVESDIQRSEEHTSELQSH